MTMTCEDILHLKNTIDSILKFIVIPYAAVTLVSCQAQESNSTSALSTTPSSSSNTSMRWNASRLPLRVSVASDFDLTEKDSSNHNLMQQMQSNWNDADSGRTYFNVSSEFTTTNKEYSALEDYLDSEIGIYRSSGWFSFIGDGVLAITSFLAEDRGSYREMLHGDIILNDKVFFFTNDTTDNSSAYDLPSVMIHELGHLLGLKHTTSSTTPSVMQPSLGRHDVQRSLQAYDSLAITELYDASFALTASNGALAITAGDEPRYIQGYMELRADGSCRHYENGLLIDVHYTKVK